MKKVYIRTDKNGTKIYHDYTCTRCGGAGYSEDGSPSAQRETAASFI